MLSIAGIPWDYVDGNRWICESSILCW